MTFATPQTALRSSFSMRCYKRHPRGKTIKELARLLTYIRSNRRRYLAGAGFLIATNGFAMLIPWLMKLAVDALQKPDSASQSVSRYALLIIICALLHCVTRIYSRTTVLNAARIIEFNIRNDLFKHLLKLDNSFFSANRTGDILSRFSNDLTNVRMLAGFGVMSSMNTVILYISAVTLMTSIHPLLTLLAILPFPIMLLIVKKVSNRMYRESLIAQEKLAQLTSLAEESVSSVRLIRSYCREEHFQEIFDASAREYLDQNLTLARLRGLIVPVMATATGAATLVVLFAGSRLVISNAITLGDFVAFSGYLAMLVWPTVMLGWIMTLSQRGASSMARLNAILSTEPEVSDSSDAVEATAIEDTIEFNNLDFEYGQTRILEGISFRIRAGETIGITGEIGSGKSTLLKLIPRLLPVRNGMPKIDGVDINQLTVRGLRTLIGYVPQETFLFSRSILENICYACNDGDANEAARQAGFSEDINGFRDGMETMIGEKGVTLSGGQRQRLSIARALLTAPQILLLDDPLSAVDAGREDEILSSLRQFYTGRTVLIVSQRLSAFRDCDRIIVLKNGKITESGTESELLSLGGIYRAMANNERS